MSFITKYIDVQDFGRTQDVETNECFENLSIPNEMIKKFNQIKIFKPSPIQVAAMPMTLCGADLLVQAKSGTGKTLVFASMSVIVTSEIEKHPQTIILAPTREICEQILSTLENINYKNLKIGLLIGGENTYETQKVMIQNGVQIIVGTVGRITQYVDDGVLDLSNVTTFIMDEADKIVEGNFKADISKIFSNCNKDKQTCVFSATYPKEIIDILSCFMIDTTMIRLDKENVQLLGVKQYVQFEIINPKMRVFTSNALLAANILKRQQFNQAIIFVNETKFLIDFACQLTKYLKEYPVQIMSGSMLQADRNNVMNDLKNKKIKVLISTDLLSRGVDSQHIDLVININIPKDVCTYLHRIGRAGRFGNYGASFTLIDNVKSLVTFNEMVYINKLNVKYLTKSMLKSSHLTVDKNIFKGGKDYNDDLSRELCYELCDAFKSVRYIEKENFKVIRYTKEDIIKIRNSKPKSDWKDIAKVIFKDSGKTFHDIDRDIFHKTQKFESNKRNDTIDKFKKLDVNDGKRNNKNSPKKENLKDKNQGNKSTKDKKNKKNDKDKNFQEKNHEESSEEYSQEETKFYEHVTEGIKVKEIELEEAESDNSVYRYSVEEMLKIRDSKTLEQWRSIFLKMNLGLKTYTDGPVVFDYELRIPFELQLRISRTRQNKAMKSAQNDILNAAKYASSFEKGKIVKNFCSDIILPSLPCKPKNLYEELYNLATGNDKYNIPINEEYLVSSSYWDKYPDMKHFKYEKTTWQEDCSNEA